MLLNNPLWKNKITRVTRMYFELNNNENKAYQLYGISQYGA